MAQVSGQEMKGQHSAHEQLCLLDSQGVPLHYVGLRPPTGPEPLWVWSWWWVIVNCWRPATNHMGPSRRGAVLRHQIVGYSAYPTE